MLAAKLVQPASDISPKGWRAVIDTNLNGTWNMMQAAAHRWRDDDSGGCIVNVVLNISRGIPGMTHSVAARAGVIYLSKTVAVEWARLRVRVNCVAPGVIESSGLAGYDKAVLERSFRHSNPQSRPGSTDDVALACLYLASPAADFITGEVLTVDGGQRLWGETSLIGDVAISAESGR
jgi:citronellol/citronellal dehydrogenase